MIWHRLFAIVVGLAMYQSSGALADYVEVSRSAFVRAQPNRSAEFIEKVSAGTRLELLDAGRNENGYYHVRASQNRRTGWIYRNRVRRKSGAIPPQTGSVPKTSNFREVHHKLCLYGCPAGASSSNDLIVREVYALSNNSSTKFADWVAYRVTTKTIGSSKSRNWKRDPDLDESVTLSPDDYKDANETLAVDRGHQAPLASFSGMEQWAMTNYLSNITPQKSDLNQGPWKRLEQKVRDLAKSRNVDAVYVMTGPLYERQMPKLPKTIRKHRVPSSYWKVVAVERGSRVRAMGFYFDQDTKRDANFCSHATKVDDIERISGLDFFYALPDETEQRVEADKNGLRIELGCGDTGRAG